MQGTNSKKIYYIARKGDKYNIINEDGTEMLDRWLVSMPNEYLSLI